MVSRRKVIASRHRRPISPRAATHVSASSPVSNGWTTSPAALIARNVTTALPNSLILIWSFFIACPTAVTADDVGAAGGEAIVPAPVFATTWPPNETAFT